MSCSRRSGLVWLVLFSFLVMPVFTTALAKEKAASDSEHALAVAKWLSIAPRPLLLPAFHEEGKGLGATDLLAIEHLPIEDLARESAKKVLAAEVSLAGGEKQPEGLAVAYLLSYLTTSSFYEGSLSVESAHPFTLYLDGEPVTGEKEFSLSLDPGRHQLAVKVIHDPELEEEWTFSAAFKDSDREIPVTVGLDSTHPLGFADILSSEVVTGVDVSPAGGFAAVHKRSPSIPKADGRSWTEFYDLAGTTGAKDRLLRTTGKRLGSLAWNPAAEGQFAFVESEGGKSTVWIEDLLGGTREALLEKIEHFAGFQWAPDGQFVVYGLTTPAKAEEEKGDGFERVKSMEQRWTGYLDKTHLYRVQVATGAVQRLTAGSLDTGLQDISPDSRRVLFTREIYDYAEWPFLGSEIWELDLQTLQAKKIAKTFWSSTARYSPDGSQLLVHGGPSAFGPIGVNVQAGATPNEYDTQAYLFDLASEKVVALTHGFDPTIQSAHWATDGRLVFQVEEGTRSRLYACDIQTRTFSRLESGVDSISRVSMARNGSRIAYYGSSVNSPGELRVIEVDSGISSLLEIPGLGEWEKTVIGKTEDFSFVASSGQTIDGVVHYPPEFDSSRKYPAIVYYYGGTSPVGRTFGGRWPKNVWASHGYLVYVLQPSGATGYGQDFSAGHVNEWGVKVVGEIIEGTEAFLAAHPFVDPEKVGCMGASYGGFMTELLVSHTELFSAAMAHAGISSLAGYWGEGWWGYIYSAIATAKKYPWNDTEYYTNQSALFRADKIQTPILLLHGRADTNVPTGQSEQLYTALRILGRDVEYVRIEGENHLIMDYDKRRKWMETIVAFFDWKLKGDSGWWDHLYPEKP